MQTSQFSDHAFFATQKRLRWKDNSDVALVLRVSFESVTLCNVFFFCFPGVTEQGLEIQRLVDAQRSEATHGYLNKARWEFNTYIGDTGSSVYLIVPSFDII